MSGWVVSPYSDALMALLSAATVGFLFLAKSIREQSGKQVIVPDEFLPEFKANQKRETIVLVVNVAVNLLGVFVTFSALDRPQKQIWLTAVIAISLASIGVLAAIGRKYCSIFDRIPGFR